MAELTQALGFGPAEAKRAICHDLNHFVSNPSRLGALNATQAALPISVALGKRGSDLSHLQAPDSIVGRRVS